MCGWNLCPFPFALNLSYKRDSSPLIIFARLTLLCPCLSCVGKSRAGLSTSSVVLTRNEGRPSLDQLVTFFPMQPKMIWPFLIWGFIVHSIWCPPGWQDPFLWSCFLELGSSKYVLEQGIVASQMSTLYFPLMNFMRFLSGQFSSLWHISRTSQFCTTGKLAVIVTCPLLLIIKVGKDFQDNWVQRKSLMKSLNSTRHRPVNTTFTSDHHLLGPPIQFPVDPTEMLV